MNQLSNVVAALVLAALITFVTALIHGDRSVIHGDRRDPQIRSGTTLKMDWKGIAYQATCKSSIGSAAGGGQATYPACELPAEWEREPGVWVVAGNGDTLSFRKFAGCCSARNRRSRNGVWRQEDFAITEAKAIGSGLFPSPPPRGARWPLN